jgi:hypothetical protein
MKLWLLLSLTAACLLAGCKKDEPAPVAGSASDPGVNAKMPGPPEAAPRPASPVNLPPAPGGDVNATLAQLTRELHRSMIGAKKLPASFEEFAANRNLNVPPPPAGKKYAISKQWRVELVDAK